MALGMLNLVAILNIFKRSIPANVDHIFRRGQLISAAAYSLGHGTNDAQKTMGIHCRRAVYRAGVPLPRQRRSGQDDLSHSGSS